MKKLIIISVIVAIVSIFAIPAVISAEPVEKVDTFVCPVLKGNGVANNPNTFGIAGGHYSLLPGKAAGDPDTHLNSPVSVPVHATNGNGSGAPGGPHSAPGDTDYTAIWNISD